MDATILGAWDELQASPAPPTWIPHGSCIDPAWIPHGYCLNTAWICASKPLTPHILHPYIFLQVFPHGHLNSFNGAKGGTSSTYMALCVHASDERARGVLVMCCGCAVRVLFVHGPVCVI